MSKRTSNLILCVGMYFVSILFMVMASRLRYPSNVWPYLTCTAILVFTTVIFGTQVILPGKKEDGNDQDQGEPDYSLTRVVLMAVASIGYAALMEIVGFYTTSLVFLVLLFNMAQKDRLSWKLFVKTVGLSLLVLAVIYVAFSMLLSVPTPTGLII